MPATFETAYKFEWTNAEGVDCEIHIYDTESLKIDPVFTDVELFSAPHLKVIDNDENRFTPIKALQLDFSFVSTAAINQTTFFGAADNRFYVELIINSDIHFKGFLITDELQEDFLDSSVSNEVRLVATDNIGLMKDAPLLNLSFVNPKGHHSIIDIVAMCLVPTGMQLDINVYHDVREENTPAQPMYRSCFLEAKTFEREVGESINCYDALSKILGQDSFITQELGAWCIKRIDEYGYATIRRHEFTWFGEYVQTIDMSPIEQKIGTNETMQFSGMVTFVKPQQPLKYVKETYAYEYPREIPDNVDFDRGALIATVSATEKTFVIADWDFLEGINDDNPVTTQGDAFIRRIYFQDYETERFAVIKRNGVFNLKIRCHQIPVGAQDKFQISVDRKYDTDFPGSGYALISLMRVRLFAHDGTYYTLHGGISSEPEPYWHQSVAINSGGQKFVWDEGNLNENQADWKTISVNAPPVPKAGDLEILLFMSVTQATEVHFQNLNFTYDPFINGSYQKYKAQHHKVSNLFQTKQALEEDVFISDSPKMLFKGGLKRYNGTRFVLTGRYYDGLQFGATVPADAFLTPFGHNQAMAVWNQNNRVFRRFDFQVQGLNTSSVLPTLLHEYIVNEAHVHSTNKRFMLLHFDMDLHLCEWTGVLAEVFDETIPRVYNDEKEFKYITER